MCRKCILIYVFTLYIRKKTVKEETHTMYYSDISMYPLSIKFSSREKFCMIILI